MAVTQTTGTASTVTTEVDLETALDTAGVYQYRIDLSALAGGASPDVYIFREYIKVLTADSAQLMEGSPVTYQGGLSPKVAEFPVRLVPASCSYRVSVEKVAGTTRSFKWARITVA